MGARRGSPSERFQRYVGEADENGCRPWLGARIPEGYGVLRVQGRVLGAHRIAYQLAYGPLPQGVFVCHRCDNRPCVEPTHLFVGDHQANMDDMTAKGRRVLPTNSVPFPKGEDHPQAKLTWEAVREIRRLHKQGGFTYQQLADRFGVTEMPVRAIIRGKTWREP